LVREIQKYVKGQHIYIPIPQTERKDWGSGTGIREELERRNEDISRRYHSGATIQELAEWFHLSEERIRSIIYQKLSE